jgi:hypothetical protein
MRGGVYSQTATVNIGTARNGTSANPVTVIAYPGETPILDFAGQSHGTNGVRLNADYWRIIGLTIRNAGHNGIRTDGSHNRLERLVVHNNHDTGIHMAGTASHNLIMNCDSYRNFNTTGNIGNNADGFGVKFDQIGPGNHLYGNRSWENSDDGFDFWRAPNPIVLQRNWAFRNGDADVFGNPVGFNGGGNGFKLGGDGVAANHIVIGNIAFENFGVTQNAKGFDHNNNSGAFRLYHNTAFNNGRNFDFPNAPANTQHEHSVFNNLSVGSGAVRFPAQELRTDMQTNSWQFGTGNVPENQFESLDTSLATSSRQEDGSLPDIPLLRPIEGSVLKGLGSNIGMSNGLASELGAYGYQKP